RTCAVILKHAARNPDQHRVPRRPKVSGPDIEVQAILPRDGTLWEEHVHRWGIRQLGRLRAIGERVAHATPGRNWLWWSEPIGAKRWRRIGNALKGVHASSNAATHLPRSGVDHCIHGGTSCKVFGSSRRLCWARGSCVAWCSPREAVRKAAHERRRCGQRAHSGGALVFCLRMEMPNAGMKSFHDFMYFSEQHTLLRDQLFLSREVLRFYGLLP